MNADRWDRLFAQLEAAQAAEAELAHADTVEQVRAAEIWSLELVDRLRAQRGALISVHMASGKIEVGVLFGAESEWVQLSKKNGQLLIAMRSVVAIGGLTGKHVRVEAEEPTGGFGHVGAPLTLDGAQAMNRLNRVIGKGDETTFRQKLRAISQDRSDVLIMLGGSQYLGKLDQIAKDHVDLWLTDRSRVTADQSISSSVSELLAVPIMKIDTVLQLR